MQVDDSNLPEALPSSVYTERIGCVNLTSIGRIDLQPNALSPVLFGGIDKIEP